MSPALVSIRSPESTKEDYESITTHIEGQILFQKGVKHLCENIGVRNVPGKYILPVSERPNYDNTLINGKNPYTTTTTTTPGTNFELPVIDFSQLQGCNRQQVLLSLSKACETYGFFQVSYVLIFFLFQHKSNS